MTESLFQTLPLVAPLLRALADKGYTQPSPIQSAAIPTIMSGNDLLACAQTGTGKTAAFALPILQHLNDLNNKPDRKEIRCLVLTPTRELAVQVADSFKSYGKHLSLRTGLVYGGVSMHPQIKVLHQGLDILVATPGRLLDLLNRGHMDLSRVRYFVLDEADRMLDMGFINDIRKIAKKLPVKRQSLLFSATMAPEVTRLASSLLNSPEEIRITPGNTTAENIDQQVLFVKKENKQALLIDLINQRANLNRRELSLIFSRTKHGARKLAQQLNRAGIRADSIHGDKSQAARQKTLNRFRDGDMPVLIATDVASRGIDVRNITLVVNYDLPNEADCYVHRIGRTARAGASGRALSFCSSDELNHLRSVERLIKRNIPVDSEHGYHAEALADRYRMKSFSNKSRGKSARPHKRFSRNKRSPSLGRSR